MERRKRIKAPEYDEKLNQLFYYPKLVKNIENCSVASFHSAYEKFHNNRLDLIDRLRNIADEVSNVRNSCKIATITGSSVGLASGAAALIGSVVFPPLFVGGIVGTVLSGVSNIGTALVEFAIIRNLLEMAEKCSRDDLYLSSELKNAYHAVTIDHFENEGDKDAMKTGFAKLGIFFGFVTMKGIATLGIRTIGLEAGSIGVMVARGLIRGAVAIGVVIDGVTIALTASSLAKGDGGCICDELRKLADLKASELDKLNKLLEVKLDT